VFDIPAGKFQFRFYRSLSGWDVDSIGAQVDDNPVDIEWIDGVSL
jgi:starch-binding outer membrane protein SusE/F